MKTLTLILYPCVFLVLSFLRTFMEGYEKDKEATEKLPEDERREKNKTASILVSVNALLFLVLFFGVFALIASL